MKIIAFLSGCMFLLTFGINYPAYFPQPHYDFRQNPLDSHVVNLGRALFYDPILSKDSSISCASCHSPFNAFAHTDHDLSHGIGDQIGTRNAPALFNLAWHKSFMWDGAIHHIEVQALAPIHHPKEMGETIESVVQKLNRTKLYQTLAYQAWGDSLLTGERVLKSLAQFQLILVSANSKYDKMKQGQAVFSEQEQKGYQLFIQYCNRCHTEPLFSHYGFENNHLPVDSSLRDYGRGAITQKKEDSLLFKVPSLRNLSYSYPYMHDGRFQQLYEVVNHYNHSFQKEALPISLNTHEKIDLVAFLLTLNDSSFVFNPNYQFPRKIFFPSEGK